MDTDISKHSIADKDNYFPAIDGLRGIAILMVLVVHASQFVGNDHVGSFTSSYLEKLVNSGARGVQLFFMVSAFTLFSSSYKRFKVDVFPKLYFYIRRAFRILPFWWLMICVIGLSRNIEFNKLIPSFFFYFGFIRYDSTYDINPQGWSLFVEECFYILLPLIFTYISNIKRSIIFTIICLFICYLWISFAPALKVPTANSFVFLFPLTHWYCFAIGILIFHIKDDLLNILNRINGLKVILLDVLALISLATLVHKNLIIASFSLMILFIVALDKRTFIGKLCLNNILIRFGGCCYSIYLFHVLLFGFISPYVNSLLKYMGLYNSSVDIKLLIFFPIAALLSLGLGTISFRFIEKPCVVLGKKLISIIDDRVRFRTMSQHRD